MILDKKNRASTQSELLQSSFLAKELNDPQFGRPEKKTQNSNPM